MKTNRLTLIVSVLMGLQGVIYGDTHYVAVNNLNALSPYTNWEAAAETIQDAVDAAEVGDVVIVSNGVYDTGGRVYGGNALTNRVVIDKAITVSSVNGPDATFIVGAWDTNTSDSAAIRCVYMNGATLDGFTITNGSAWLSDGGQDESGGGIFADNANVLNCIITGCRARQAGGVGFLYNSYMTNCVISGNYATHAAGGVGRGVLYNCLISGNHSHNYNGGTAWAELYNCTIVGNSASNFSGGGAGYVNENCIIYNNEAPTYPNSAGDNTWRNCCTFPMPAGTGNITNDPCFVNPAADSYQLQSASPCIDAGTNQAWLVGAKDLDGNNRIINNIVDMGAYEFAGVTPIDYSSMVLIPAGEYVMGDALSDGIASEKPTHTVYVSDFSIGQYEVTKAWWDEVYLWAITNGYSFDNAGSGKATNHPVHTINWYDMVKWCNALSEKAGLTPCYYTNAAQSGIYRSGRLNLGNDWVKWAADGYRLPTEAEWEKAARGGAVGHRFGWSDSDEIQHARVSFYSTGVESYDTSPTSGYHPAFTNGGVPYSSPVDYFDPNGYGLHDVSGNMMELVWDWYDGSWYSKEGATTADTRGPESGTYRVNRPASWERYAYDCRVSYRAYITISEAGNRIGFRVARGHASALGAPSNLVAVTISTNQIDLIWQDGNSGETGFVIERKTGSGGIWEQAGATGADITNYSDQGLSAGTLYYYRVAASNASGLSPYSAQASAATSGGQPSAYTNMVLIPAGEYVMGDALSDGVASEKPIHTVYVSDFYVGQFEVSKAWWDEVYLWAITHGYSFDNAGSGKATNHPVHTINWYDMVKWCNALSEKEGLTPCYYTNAAQSGIYRSGRLNLGNDWVKWAADGYRLPTEAEWEKAARGGAVGRRFGWSDSDEIQHARVSFYSTGVESYDTSPTRGYHPAFTNGGVPYSSPVDYFAPNGYGLHDVSGNMMELVWDWYDGSWYSKAGASTPDTRGPESGTYRVNRPASWERYAYDCRVSYRAYITISEAANRVGFRVARGHASALGAPSNLVAVAISTNQVDLIWQDGNSDETGFVIERKTGSAGIWEQAGATGANNTNYSDQGLLAGTLYYYRVAASNASGLSPYSTHASAATPAGQPSAFTNMVLIPAGEYVMGDALSDGVASEKPTHTVYVSDFYVGQFEVSKAWWDEVYLWAITHGYSFDNEGSGKASNHPVHTINWYDMVKWCNALSEKEGLTPCYYTNAAYSGLYRTGRINLANDWVKWAADGYRLPTEAEWEKAARGGVAGHRFSWSDSDEVQHARVNFYSTGAESYDTSPTRGYHPAFSSAGTPYTSPVDYFAPNGYGLYDMSGNLMELVWDWYDGNWYSQSGALAPDTRGPETGTYRVERMGSWERYAHDCRVSYRAYITISEAANRTGFRVARSHASALGAPSNLVATAISTNQIDLTWKDGSSDETGFVIERKAASGGGWALAGATSADITNFSDCGLSVGSLYYYRVAASNESGLSPYSAEASALTEGGLPITNVDMVLIPAGDGVLGDGFGDGSSSERPVHTNYISAFYLGKYEVTKAQWDTVSEWALANGYSFDSSGSGSKEWNHPVCMVRWFDAAKWCNALSEKEGLTPCYYTDASMTAVYRTGQLNLSNNWVNWDADGYRLPTEAEWEKAARGGVAGTRFPWDDFTNRISHAKANFNNAGGESYAFGATGYHPVYAVGEEPFTSPGGSFAPNGYGLCDLSGNLAEWCWDWLDSAWYGNAAATAANTRGPGSGVSRVVKGGAYQRMAWDARCAARNGDEPVSARLYTGFRCAQRGPAVSPSTPSNLLAVAASTSRIDLQWQDTSGEETGFIIERKSGEAGDWGFLAAVAANATNHADTGLDAGTLYSYRIFATNQWGQSAASEPAAATTFNTAQVFLLGLAQAYDGTPRYVTATTMPAGLIVAITYDGGATAPVAVGSYAAAGTVQDAGYQGAAAGTLVVSKGAQTVTFAPIGFQQRTNVLGLAASASSGLPVGFAVASGPAILSDGTNLAFTGTGLVSVVASQAGDANWAAAPDVTNTFDVIDKPVAAVQLVGLSQVYDGTPRVVTAATEPAGLAVDISYNGSATAPVAAGSYAVTGLVNDAEYQGVAVGTLVVGKAPAEVFLGSLAQDYNGSARAATATTMPAGLLVVFTYNSEPAAPVNAGAYAVTGTVVDANYQGSAAGTLVVSPINQAITFPPIPAQSKSGQVGLAATASSGLPVAFAVASGPGVLAGGTNLSFSSQGSVVVVASQAGNLNWNPATPVTNTVLVTNTPPLVCVATQHIYLANQGEMAMLDAACSSDADGDQVFFSWREYYRNPQLNLIPLGAERLSRMQLYFPTPGRYQFEVRVSDGLLPSLETRTVTVYVPGLKGVVELASSDGSVVVPDAQIEVYANAVDASLRTNCVDAAVADSLGQYTLECIGPEGPSTPKDYYWRVTRAGFMTSEVTQVTVQPDPGFDDDQYDLPVSREMLAALTGKVLDQAGNPIQGVNVAIAGVGGTPRVATTSASGDFALNNIPYGTWVLQLQKSAYQSEARDICVWPGMGPVVVHLAPSTQTGSLAGLVTLAGSDNPIAGATVTLGSQSATTASDGSYQFQDLYEGYYVLTVAKADYTTERYLSVKINAGANSLDVALSYATKGPTVQGVAVDGTSALPIWRATAKLLSVGGQEIRNAVTDRTGHFQLYDVPVGSNQTLRITAPGYLAQEVQLAVVNSCNVTTALARSQSWQEPAGPDLDAPVARVATNFIALHNMNGSATLDGRNSLGDSLYFVWRENPDNPVVGMLPEGVEYMDSFTLSDFTMPGIYRFELQVKEGAVLSENTEIVTVYVPGLVGNVHASPSDWVYGIAQATVRGYANYQDAILWSAYFADSKLSANEPAGDFQLSSISTGSYWIVARGLPGAGYNQYGPQRKQVNGSSGARKMPVNMPRAEYALYGRITNTNGAGLENVRVVLTTGVKTETYRTTTGTNGEYRLNYVPNGSHPMMLVKDGYRAETVYVTVTGDTEWNYMLEGNAAGTWASLCGTVYASYNGILLPLPQATVQIGGNLARVLTDDNGQYCIEGLPPGYYTGVIRKPGYHTHQLHDGGFLYLAPGANTHNATLQFHGQGPVVRGVVMNERGETLQNVSVTVMPPEGTPVRRQALLAATTDDDLSGVFQLSGVPEGSRRLRVTLPSGLVFTSTVYVAGSMETVIEAPSEYTAFNDWIARFPAMADVRAAADPDADGWSNWEEFICDTAPNSATSYFMPAFGTKTGGQFYLWVEDSSTGRTYGIWGCTSLFNQVWQPRGSTVQGTGGSLPLSVPDPLPCEYLRTGAELP